MSADSRPIRILIVKLSSLGDIIHALPTSVSLRAAHPDARLAWVVERRWLPLVAEHAGLDEVFSIDSFRWRAAPHDWRHLADDLARVRAFRADWALDLQGTVKSGLVTRASGARRRAGFAHPAVREPLSGIFYTDRVQPRSAHVVDELLDLGDVLGPLSRRYEFPLAIPPAADEAVTAWMRRRQLQAFVLLSPGGGWASKRWPDEYYHRLAGLLWERHGLACVVNRGASSGVAAAASAAAGEPIPFYGSVLELAALARRASLVVGGDTGPLHLAAVLGTPVVGLFGPTDPARNGPMGQRARVLRNSKVTTYRRSGRVSEAMKSLLPEEVAVACSELLDAARSRVPAT